MWERVSSMVERGMFTANVHPWDLRVCSITTLHRGTQASNPGIEAPMVDFKANQPSPPPSSNQINHYRATRFCIGHGEKQNDCG